MLVLVFDRRIAKFVMPCVARDACAGAQPPHFGPSLHVEWHCTMTSLSGHCEAFRSFLQAHPRNGSFSRALELQKARLHKRIGKSHFEYDEALRCIATLENVFV